MFSTLVRFMCRSSNTRCIDRPHMILLRQVLCCKTCLLRGAKTHFSLSAHDRRYLLYFTGCSSEQIKSGSPLYTSTLPKTAIRSDFVCPQSSEDIPIGGLHFANLFYIVNKQWRVLAMSVTQFLVLIGCR